MPALVCGALLALAVAVVCLLSRALFFPAHMPLLFSSFMMVCNRNHQDNHNNSHTVKHRRRDSGCGRSAKSCGASGRKLFRIPEEVV